MEFLAGLGESMAQYGQSAGSTGWLWAILAAVIAPVAALLGVRISILAFPAPAKGPTASYSIQSRLYIAACVVVFAVIALAVYAEFSGVLSTEPGPLLSALSILAALLGGLAMMFIVLWRLSRQYERSRFRELLSVPLSPHDEALVYGKSRTSFFRLKLWALLPAAAYLLMFVFQRTPQNHLLAIVLDNSTSMEAPISIGKQALSAVLANSSAKTDLIITTLSPGTKKQSFSDVVKATDMAQLAGTPTFFDASDRANAEAYVSRVEASNPDSPVLEAMWKTYLLAARHAQSKPYDTHMLVVATDGADNMEKYEDFLCSDPSFNALFDVGSVHFIHAIPESASGSTSYQEIPFFQAAQTCSYAVRDGTDAALYLQSLQDAIGDLNDGFPYLTLLTAILYAAGLAACLITTPVKLERT